MDRASSRARRTLPGRAGCPGRAGRPARGRRPVLAALLAILIASGALALLPAARAAAAPEDPGAEATRSLPLKIVPRGVDEVRLEPADPAHPESGYRYVVDYQDGHTELLTPDAFAELLYTEFSGRNSLFALLNITSPVGVAWVALGLLGQVLFTGRMLVQWVASERKRRSVVPTAFWWMSLGGATMLIVYFIWRKDIVGVLGQATGWFIYVRNLRLIYRSAPDEESALAR